jgi:hypothetical protein
VFQITATIDDYKTLLSSQTERMNSPNNYEEDVDVMKKKVQNLKMERRWLVSFLAVFFSYS